MVNHSNKLKYSDSQRIDYLQLCRSKDTPDMPPLRDYLDAAMNAGGYLYGSDWPVDPATGERVIDPHIRTRTGPTTRQPDGDLERKIDHLVPWDSTEYLAEKKARDEAKAAEADKPRGH